MMMGELDFINSFVEPLTDDDPATLHYTYLAYTLLVIVVILLPILLMNLLVSMANVIKRGDIANLNRLSDIRKLLRISERTFSELGARVYIRLHLILETFRIYPKVAKDI